MPSGALAVTFTRSAKTVVWSPEDGTLLDLAEIHGIDISAGCRYGDCGTCSTRLLQGVVGYLHTTGAGIDPGMCLPCSCRPLTPIELDL